MTSDKRARETLLGSNGVYWIDPSKPLTYGRLSVLFAGENDQGRAICVKLFRDELESIEGKVDFTRELQVLRQFDHPSILPLIDFGNADGLAARPFLVTPLCDGGNLRSALLNRRFLPVEQAVIYLRDVASALDYAHERGVIHGDVKPENILLANDRAKLADFGAARYRLVGRPRRGRSSGRMMITGSYTEMYASPEQIEHELQSVRSDVYSFAMVAFELLTGELPVDDNQPSYQQMRAKVEGRLRRPMEVNPSLPPGVSNALLTGLHRDSRRRPRSAGEVVLAIENGLHDTGTLITSSSLTNQVFLVHGRNDAAKERVARFLNSIGLKVVILHEMPSSGRTIIEKIEAYADVGAAVILLTGDDLGGDAERSHYKFRARQNVIFELGYFAAKLSRQRTIALYSSVVELPSDYIGVVYIPFDDGNSWQIDLFRELRAAGLDVNSDGVFAP